MIFQYMEAVLLCSPECINGTLIKKVLFPPYRVEVWQTVPVAVTFGSAFLVSCISKYIVQLKRVTSRL